jgi:urease accessory protein UreH
VRGDRFETDGFVGTGASLVVAAQSATRALGAGRRSESVSHWRVAAHASLALLGEPLVAYAGAGHRSELVIDLDPNATVTLIDVALANGTFASVASRIHVVSGGRIALYDAWELEPQIEPRAIGSAYVLAPGSDAETLAAMRDAADDALSQSAREAEASGFRAGADLVACGGVGIRAVGPHATILRTALVRAVASIEIARARVADDATLVQRAIDRPAGPGASPGELMRYG